MREIEKNDLVSFDTDLIGPYGYCSDISRAWVCSGKPTDEQRRLYSIAYEQIQHNISVLSAGMTFREVSQKCWKIPDEFLSHRYDGLIEPGMTLCVESFIGSEGGREGIKLEEQVIISENGVKRLSTYPFELDLL